MVLSHISKPPSMTPASMPQSRDQSGFTLRTFLSSFAIELDCTLWVGFEHVAPTPASLLVALAERSLCPPSCPTASRCDCL